MHHVAPRRVGTYPNSVSGKPSINFAPRNFPSSHLQSCAALPPPPKKKIGGKKNHAPSLLLDAARVSLSERLHLSLHLVKFTQ